MFVVGYILLWTGLIAWTVGNFMFLVVVFRYSTAWFFGCMLVPFADWIYFFLYMKQTWKPMLIGTMGFVAACIGGWLVAMFAS
jgi:hypothetical protein